MAAVATIAVVVAAAGDDVDAGIAIVAAAAAADRSAAAIAVVDGVVADAAVGWRHVASWVAETRRPHKPRL